jgi:hypothetical protein
MKPIRSPAGKNCRKRELRHAPNEKGVLTNAFDRSGRGGEI